MILIPCISVHWSLIIVCIPDKEDESGLTILHLDSLGVHPKRSIVENVKRYGNLSSHACRFYAYMVSRR